MRHIASIFLVAACISSCNRDSGTSNSKANDCFVYKMDKDSAFLQIDIHNDIVKGELAYHLFEKDNNQGSIEGRIVGDTIFAKYKFMSEGVESIREVAFLKKSSNWVEGFGEVEDKNGSMVFKDHLGLKFESGLLFKEVPCPKAAD
ncbi:hypothetical protein [Dyadobacter arcticus]|uniref:Lipoprotein n=1 Tax=Dyadobacter arcticus TaxID=1078754 RepID=A0ABX0UIL3_9BACT|nr:hypothetical protein [Dyadobacter arcticus]NIJ51879.1 hypothetical protein [Dyadobacter arcticus]